MLACKPQANASRVLAYHIAHLSKAIVCLQSIFVLCNAFFKVLALLKKNIFFDMNIVVKNKSKCGLYSTKSMHSPFSQTIFFCFCMLSEFSNVFERKV